LALKDDDARHENVMKFVSKILFELCRISEIAQGKGQSSRSSSLDESFLGEVVVKSILDRLHSEDKYKHLDVSRLELRCANADPNYGPLWFYCRVGPTDTARLVLTRGIDVILDEVKLHANLYISAILRRFAIIARFEKKQHSEVQEGTSAWEKLIDEECLSAPSLKQIIEYGNKKITEAGVEFLETSIPPSDFITGIVALSRHRPIEEMTSSERRKTLFGTDSIFS
jgi:hypothetical protein